jgi:hypothetical protein
MNAPAPARSGAKDHPESSTAADHRGEKERGGSRTVGKYPVSPLIKALGDGWFASSVSIRSGSGRGTSDRILRLTQVFRCATEAAEFAHGEALRWIDASRRSAAA